jgi:hypothetical protein
MNRNIGGLLLWGFLGAGVVACSGGGSSMSERDAEPIDITVADVGFATPESVLHDEQADVYLVSNINGSPTDRDGNGFISRLSTDGEVLDLKWIDGESGGVTLNAPKGMALAGDLLYVADIDCIRMFDRSTGAAAGEECVPNASFLNDVAAAIDGGILFTDTGLDPTFSPSGTDALYRLDDNGRSTVIANAQLGAPNGVIDTRDGPLVVTFMSGEVFRVGIAGNYNAVSEASERQLDGVVALADGRILMSSWGESCVMEMAPDGSLSCIISGLEAPADIGVDRGRNRVLVPLFNGNAVVIRSVP